MELDGPRLPTPLHLEGCPKLDNYRACAATHDSAVHAIQFGIRHIISANGKPWARSASGAGTHHQQKFSSRAPDWLRIKRCNRFGLAAHACCTKKTRARRKINWRNTRTTPVLFYFALVYFEVTFAIAMINFVFVVSNFFRHGFDCVNIGMILFSFRMMLLMIDSNDTDYAIRVGGANCFEVLLLQFLDSFAFFSDLNLIAPSTTCNNLIPGWRHCRPSWLSWIGLRWFDVTASVSLPSRR